MRRKVFSIVLLFAASMLTLSSCAPLAELTIVSNRNIEVGAKYVSKGAFKGSSKFAMVLFIPLTFKGTDPEYALDDALAKGGGDFMTNVVIEQSSRSYVFYTESGWTCTGEVWARADQMSMSELEGKEIYEMQMSNGFFELVSVDNPSVRISAISTKNNQETQNDNYDQDGTSQFN